MLRRILIGSALLIVLALAVFADGAIGRPAIGASLTFLMVLLAQHEVVRSSMGGAPGLEARIAAIAVLAAPFFAVAPAGRIAAMAGAVMGGTLLILAVEMFRLQFRPAVEPGEHARRAMASVFTLAAVAAPLGFLLAGADARGAAGTLWAVLVVTISKCGDIGGYLVGTLAGKHVMLPRVSPKKSWEGSLGGLLLTVGAVFAVSALAPDILGVHPTWRLALFGLVVNLATQLGDFSESMLKRSWQVKDSAALVPTFGGALDIIDSLMFAAPVAFWFLWVSGSLA